MTNISFGEVRAAFREMVVGMNMESYAEVAKAAPMTVVTAPMIFPAWTNAERLSAGVRLLGLSPIVAKRLVVGLTLPERDELPPAPSEREFWVEYEQVLRAGGRVLDELVLHGAQDTRHLDDGSGWRRVSISAQWPAEALAALVEAQKAVQAFAGVWMAYRLAVKVSA